MGDAKPFSQSLGLDAYLVALPRSFIRESKSLLPSLVILHVKSIAED